MDIVPTDWEATYFLISTSAPLLHPDYYTKYITMWTSGFIMSMSFYPQEKLLLTLTTFMQHTHANLPSFSVSP